MGEMDQFFTREAANEGISVPLYRPDGSETEHYLQVCGVDSDRFRAAEAKARRRMLEAAASQKEGGEVLIQVQADELLTAAASLVLDWSFDQPCTQENVKAFLQEAPQIADQINKVAARRALFFVNRQSDSAATPKAPSDSAEPQPEPEPR